MMKKSCSVCSYNLKFFESQLKEQKAQLEQIHRSEKAILLQQNFELSRQLKDLFNSISEPRLTPMEDETKQVIIPYAREKPRETVGEAWPPEYFMWVNSEQRRKELLRPFPHK